MIYLLLILTLSVGLVLGGLGGGGGILMTPLLTYVGGMPASQAIPTSLAVVGVSSLVSVARNIPRKVINWRVGGLLALCGMVGSFAGGILSGYLPDNLKMVLFACIMLISAWRMLAPHKAKPARTWSGVGTALAGVGVGIISGTVGAGGGFLLVPVLALGVGLPMFNASATSLLVIAAQTLTGLSAHLTHISLDWQLTALLTGITIVGMLIGISVAHRLPDAVLKKAFGWLIVFIALVTLAEELSLLVLS